MVKYTGKLNIPILMYHSISDNSSSRDKQYCLSTEVFEEHLSYLAQCHYTSLTVTQLVNTMVRGGDGLPPRPVVLTFDDGYADFYTNVFPALQRHSFRATLYIPTAFIGGTCSWLKQRSERVLSMITWEQLAEVCASGIECGSHSHTHASLDMVPPSIARDEIVRSKEQLEEHLRQEILSFAYPYGYYTKRVKQIVQESGYTSACAVKNAVSSLQDDPYSLARLAITKDTQMDDLAIALSIGEGPLVASPVKQVSSRIRQRTRSLYWQLWCGWNNNYASERKKMEAINVN